MVRARSGSESAAAAATAAAAAAAADKLGHGRCTRKRWGVISGADIILNFIS
jgi:hypothetical protein